MEQVSKLMNTKRLTCFLQNPLPYCNGYIQKNHTFKKYEIYHSFFCFQRVPLICQIICFHKINSIKHICKVLFRERLGKSLALLLLVWFDDAVFQFFLAYYALCERAPQEPFISFVPINCSFVIQAPFKFYQYKRVT